MSFKKVVIAGGGVLGSQIAMQTAYCGFDVTIWLRSEESKTRCQPKLDRLKEDYTQVISEMASDSPKIWALGISSAENFSQEKCLQKVEDAYQNIKLETDLAKAVEDADLVIESLSEDLNQKIEFYKKLAPTLPEKTIVVTNSSTLLPSKMAKYTGRAEKFLALHFANNIWKNNTAEVMCHKDTKKECFDEVLKFAEEINMIPLPIYQEKAGYLLNSMLVPFLLSAMDLYANGVGDPEDIDLGWVVGIGAPVGPFRIMDIVGLETVKNIIEQYQKVPGIALPVLKKMFMPYNYKGMLEIINKLIAEGKTGKAAGEGFYKYND